MKTFLKFLVFLGIIVCGQSVSFGADSKLVHFFKYDKTVKVPVDTFGNKVVPDVFPAKPQSLSAYRMERELNKLFRKERQFRFNPELLAPFKVGIVMYSPSRYEKFSLRFSTKRLIAYEYVR